MLSKIAIRVLNEKRPAREIMLIDCRWCGNQSYYDGGFTCGCEHCGKRIDQQSEDAYNLEDSWEIQVFVP